ncbi:WLM domain containing protein [Trema orientale]|uniref:WLM domain containing protein n=1 Tax=Trema orientale TaxID=63057 RepID=A0A2P5F8E8_TREOI|nr:WLM domain containing protein [Trema orientale]
MNNVGDLNKVWETKALKKPGEDEARRILEKVAKQVQPIMRKHKWRVKLLSEFYPNNPSLLGLNVGNGIQVKLRLRRPNREWDFFPFDQILDTMLHELCHNAHGPHNANFYKLWDELRQECEELMAKGISGTGEGFDLLGRRLGGFSRQPPLSSLRSTALAAAEKRSRLGSLLPSGPKRLGGDSTIMVALSPIQAAAMAAERRLQDDIWCGSVSCEASESGDGTSDKPEDLLHVEQTAGTSKAHSESSANASDLISRKRSREPNNFSSVQSPNGHSKSNFIDLTDSSPSGSVLNHDTENIEQTTMWECGTCTLLNPPLAPICEVCGTEKPRDVVNKYKIWSCKFCTLENSVKLDKCCACGQWRYSHGPPMAALPPNLGT